MFIYAGFLDTASSGDEDYCHDLDVCQVMKDASFVLTFNIRTQGVMHNNDRLSGARSQREVSLRPSADQNSVTSVKFHLLCASVQFFK